MGAGWSASHVTDFTGKRILITGANSGIGYFTARALGNAGADVIIACRNKEKGEEALAKLRKECPHGKFELRLLDLTDLKDVARFSDEFNAQNVALDVLINNAGVMTPPYELTKDGFELQLGTNHLGHFALTGHLLKSLLKSESPRVVVVASLAALFAPKHHHEKDIDFTKSESSYSPFRTYAESKLANLLFMRELGRRYPKIVSVAAHPGASSTNLQRHHYSFAQVLSQSAENGALPTLRAVCEGTSGEFYGPRGIGWAGYPKSVSIPHAAKDDAYALKMWQASEKATGVTY